MLTALDLPTIQNAIRRRLDEERGVFVFLPILMQPYSAGDHYLDLETRAYRVAGEPFIRVGMMTLLDHTIVTRSWFDLPDPFEHGHLLNEVDEIAEQLKEARKDHTVSSLTAVERKVKGTGLRGRWSRYGTLMGREG